MPDATRPARRSPLVPALLAWALLCCSCLLLPAAAAGATRWDRRSCQTRGITWAANEHLRLFQWGMTLDGWNIRYWVCRTGARRPHFLVSHWWEYPNPHAAIGGHFVIHPRSHCDTADDYKSTDRASCRGGISIYDARSDRTRFVRLLRQPDGFVPSVYSYAVTERGWAAWTTADGGDSARQAVWILRPGGSPERIAETASGRFWDAPLAVSGDRLFWQLGDQTGSRLLR